MVFTIDARKLNLYSFFSDFCDAELDVAKMNVFVGDVNIDLLKDNCYAKKLRECINNTTMKQIITEPTRITVNSRTLIDHVMTKKFTREHTKIIELKDRSELCELKKAKNALYETAFITDKASDWDLFKRARNRYVNKINYASKMDLMKDIRK